MPILYQISALPLPSYHTTLLSRSLPVASTPSLTTAAATGLLRARASGMEARGLDSEGREFSSAREMWAEEIGSGEKRQEWYQKGIAYWQGVEASTDGVLGGYGVVNDTDVKGSEEFLKPLLVEKFGGERRNLVALDCGSGIGRVTKNLLLRHFNEVDLVEPVKHFLDTARENLSADNLGLGNSDATHKAVNFHCVPLQEFVPEAGRYDVIWVQWCIGSLPDDDFVAFFRRAKAGLTPNGFFVLKENIAKSGFVLDKEDRSITRSDSYFKELFQRCGLHVYRMKDQKGFPQELFAVNMYALVTDKPREVRGRSKPQTRLPAIIKS